MSKASAKKTKSVRNNQIIVVGLLLLVLVLSGFGLLLVHNKSEENRNIVPAQNTACVKLGSGCFKLERLEDNPKRLKGLSDRDSLPQDHGLLFVFDDIREQCMWMKDMKFSIDMVWLDEQKKIVKIEDKVSPETYPKAFCADNTKYVIELNAGVAGQAGLKIGDRLQL